VTSFVTLFGTYYYVTIPFGLKNTGAIYQRCMLTIFRDLIGRTVEVYVDDIIVKSKQADNLVVDLDQAFKCLWAKNIKINPKKCVCGILRGMLLGFIIFERGIEANPEKMSTIANMGPIKDLKGVQRVTRCLAVLSHFISCLDE
jgi:hypothetical protein